jgi:short-subunit dehydrogenase
VASVARSRALAEHGFDVLRVSEAEYDLSTPHGVEALHASLDRSVDVLALNAGVSEGGEFAAGDLHAYLHLIDLNVEAPFTWPASSLVTWWPEATAGS